MDDEKALTKPKRRGLPTARVFPPLPTLDQMIPPDDAAEYLGANQGRYVLMLETLVNAAAEQGMLETAQQGTQFLVKLTELGRKKIDQKIEVRQLRDEYDLSKAETNELLKIIKKRKGDDETVVE